MFSGVFELCLPWSWLCCSIILIDGLLGWLQEERQFARIRNMYLKTILRQDITYLVIDCSSKRCGILVGWGVASASIVCIWCSFNGTQ
ncbi:hypothetical protein FRX31_025297 [Thalictrum thalictroides]|uniref:Uncharacterized protein n=1 Tax=Thalictrum thalictroides TaxID=46969 RepID=A0A7J6VJ23_THATH|nr:hypothetical protein FRX31_025297 [Thalictrum thalictroides]